MKANIYERLRKLQLLVAVTMAVYPIHWLAAGWLGGTYIGVCGLFSLFSIMAGCIAFSVPGKLRPVFGITVCLFLLAGAVFFGRESGLLLWTAQALIAWVPILWSLPAASRSGSAELSGYWISFGITMQVIGQIVLLTDWAVGYPGWMLRLSFFIYILLVMLSVNRQSLLEASGKRRSVPGSLKRRNMLLTGILFSVSLLGGLLPSAVSTVKELLLTGLRWVAEKLEQLLSKIGSGAGNVSAHTEEAFSPTVIDAGTVLQLHPVLETVILYIGAMICVGFSGLLLFQLGKKLVRFAQDSWDLVGRFFSVSAEDYVDEVSDTRDVGEAEQTRSRKHRRSRYREDPTLPPSEQIRRRYQYLKHDHKDWVPGATAREKLPAPAAKIYEYARYSERGVSPEDARTFIDMAKDL